METQTVRIYGRSYLQHEKYGILFLDEFVLMISGKPFNYQNAMSDFEYDIWLRVMNAEMQSMYNNQVWLW